MHGDGFVPPHASEIWTSDLGLQASDLKTH